MYEQFQNIMKMGPFGQIMVRHTDCVYCVYAYWFILCTKIISDNGRRYAMCVHVFGVKAG